MGGKVSAFWGLKVQNISKREKNILMKKNRRLEILYSVSAQLAVIAALFEWLFFIAPHSRFYAGWSDNVRGVVRFGGIFGAVVLAALLIIAAVCVVKLGRMRKPDAVFWCSVALFVFQILVRINLLGVYQESDADLYFTAINRIAGLHDDVIAGGYKSGFIFGHIAYGFIFVSLLGQLLDTAGGMGFQYAYMVMGAAAAVCLFKILRKIFPKKNVYFLAVAAFIISMQPMYFGLSAMIQMEYPLAILFIFTVCAYFYKKYILMFFWLIMLGTCKETGAMMAFSVLFFAVVYEIADYVKRCGGIRDSFKKLKKWQVTLFVLFAVSCIAVFVAVINIPMWGGVRIIDVLKIGGSGNLNFQFNSTHFLLKVRQLFILNFSWVWVAVIVICTVVIFAVPKVRKRRSANMRVFSFILIQYAVYTMFLLFFLEAKQPRYNILSDVLFLFMAMSVVIEAADRVWLFAVSAAVIGTLSVTECFLTVDLLSRAVFTSVNTGAVPMVWTAADKKKLPEMNINIGDFGYYNYQYAYMDKAFDRMLADVEFTDDFVVLSSFNPGIEDQLANEELVWDSQTGMRTYNEKADGTRFHTVKRILYSVELEMWNHDEKCIYVEIPWCRNTSENALTELAEIYEIDGPYTSRAGVAAKITYYILNLK